MYDDLVKPLREVEEKLRIAQFEEARSLIEDDADAIKELTTELECLKSYMGEYKAAYIAEHDARMAGYRTDKEEQCPSIHDLIRSHKKS